MLTMNTAAQGPITEPIGNHMINLKKGDKGQELIQLSITPNPGHLMGK